MKIRSIFPIPIGHDRIETNYQPLLAVTTFEQGNDRLEQTTGDLKDRENWSNLALDIFKCARSYAREVGWGSNIEMIQMWCNRMHPLATIHPHSHSNSLFSCVFYIFDTPAGTRFLRGDGAHNQIQPSNLDYERGFLYDEFTTQPQKGDIVFFPSHLKHWSMPVDAVRYTVSANFRATQLGDAHHLNLG